MPSRRTLIGQGAGALALAGALTHTALPAAAQDDGTPGSDADDDNGAERLLGTPIFTPGIDIVQAQEIAIEGHDGAAVRSVELDGDDGVLVYEVKLDNGVEVEIDATTGEIVETRQDDDDDNGEDDDDDDDDRDDDDDGEDDDDD
jgi:uncharacterized membrane protein YkoI